MTGAALALAACLAAARVQASPRAVQPPAPEFPSTAVWLNAKPLTLAQLRGGRLVVVAFVNLANLNSLRALAVLKAWDARYALDGVSVIAVHTPLYPFQKSPAEIRAQLKRLGVTFPVVLDDEGALWKAYANDGWPAFYLIDEKSRIDYDLLGEGNYAEFETEMRDLLVASGRPAPAGALVSVDPPQQDCGAATGELAFGLSQRHGAKLVDLDAAKQTDDDQTAGADDDQPAELVVSGRDGEVDTQGAWRRQPDSLRLAALPGVNEESFIRVIYRGAQVFALLAGPRDQRPSRFSVRQDGLSLNADNAGPDVLFDPDGQSYVEAGKPRLYWLTKNPNDSMHTLTLLPSHVGAGIFGLQFTDRCLPYQP